MGGGSALKRIAALIDEVMKTAESDRWAQAGFERLAAAELVFKLDLIASQPKSPSTIIFAALAPAVRLALRASSLETPFVCAASRGFVLARFVGGGIAASIPL